MTVGRGKVILLRGPIGSGKTTLLRGLGRRPKTHFWILESDRALDFHPSDPHGKHPEHFRLEVDLLALHGRIVLERGWNLLIEFGYISRAHLDRFLRGIGRSRRDPRVLLLRLTVDPRVAVRRKATLTARYVLASHRGWQPEPVSPEIVIDTDGLRPSQVLQAARTALRSPSPRRGRTTKPAGP
ncbi:MAG: ATP-binding protein [Thermoplasmata archaeon]|nr:ATP-binding protein [Thermoplasmata archaeon]